MKSYPLSVLCLAIVLLTMPASEGKAKEGHVNTSSGSYTKETTSQLIDDLTRINSQSPGIDSAGVYEGFIATGKVGSFRGGVLGIAPPSVPPEMIELVRRGTNSLPELLQHLDDNRPTGLRVGNIEDDSKSRQVGVNTFMFTVFSNEYDPRVRIPVGTGMSSSPRRFSERDFHGSYTVKVGDVCFVLIGQIVNRRLFAVRYQPSAGLVVNSLTESPELAVEVRRDWAATSSDQLRDSLMSDLQLNKRGPYEEETVFPALERLRFYFPNTYTALKGDDRKKRIDFERRKH